MKVNINQLPSLTSTRRANLIKLTSLDLLANKKMASAAKQLNRLSVSAGTSVQACQALLNTNAYVIAVRSTGVDAVRLALEGGIPLKQKKMYSLSSIKELYPLLVDQPDALWLIDILSAGGSYLIEFETFEEYLVGIRALMEFETSASSTGGKFVEILFVREEQHYIDFRFESRANTVSAGHKLYGGYGSKAAILLELVSCLLGVTQTLEAQLTTNIAGTTRVVCGNTPTDS